METNYEKRGYLLDDFRLFHLKDKNGTKYRLSLSRILQAAAPAQRLWRLYRRRTAV